MAAKNAVLLAFSLIFYATGRPLHLALLVGLSWVNFFLAKRIRPGFPITVWLPVALNIGVLAAFKYLPGASLPMGISFYTFSMIAYLADVYLKRTAAEQKFSSLLLYLTMFPKLLQGPIVRYRDVAPQLTQRTTSPQAAFEGGLRFAAGLAKKVLLADYCGSVIAELAGIEGNFCFLGAWLTGILFAFRLYFDFSGYSDMAIGLGKIFGFTYRENFNLPYAASSVSDFWRRWHISLGSFFRDYVYIPLGGSRVGWHRQVINLLVVWVLTGVWHGSGWNYVLWGLYFFAALTAERKFRDRLDGLPLWSRRVITLAVVFFGWVIFANEDLGTLGHTLISLLGFHGFSAPGVAVKLVNSLPLMAVCVLGCTALPRQVVTYWYFLCRMDRDDGNALLRGLYLASAFILMAGLLALCTVSLVGNTSAPSIYGGF